MKTNALLAFLFFFVPFASGDLNLPVYDTDGYQLGNGGKYYLAPCLAGAGGSKVIMAAAVKEDKNDTWSLAVVQDYHISWPTIIATPLNINYIYNRFPLNISFSHLPLNSCTNTSNWIVTRYVPIGEPVMVGSAKEFGSPELRGWFYIDLSFGSPGNYHEFYFCRREIDDCGDVGYYTDSHNNTRLVVGGSPLFEFKLVKVPSCVSSSDISMVA